MAFTKLRFEMAEQMSRQLPQVYAPTLPVLVTVLIKHFAALVVVIIIELRSMVEAQFKAIKLLMKLD